MGKKNLKLVYLVVNEDLTSPLLTRQVTELLIEEVASSGGALSVNLLLFQTAPSLVKRWRRLSRLKKSLKEKGVNLSVILNITPWPLPNCRLRRTDVGLRPDGSWNRFAAKAFAAYALPFLAYQVFARQCYIFHSRSYPPAFAIQTLKAMCKRVKHVFDPRSDFPEENVTADRWTFCSRDFKFWKRVEENLLCAADATVCISEEYLKHFRKSAGDFRYILAPNNVDTCGFHYRPSARATLRDKLGWSPSDLVFVYLGGISREGWHRPEFYREFLAHIRTFVPGCKLLLLIPANANAFVEECFSGVDGVTVCNPRYDKVSHWLSAADVGLLYLHKRKMAVGTKLGEYLAAGLPILCNSNCLGAKRFLRTYRRAGRVVDLGLGDVDREPSKIEAEDIMRFVRRRQELAQLAREVFDNSRVASKYLELYASLTDSL